VPGPDNKYQRMAREAAERIERQGRLGEQLPLLPEGAPVPESRGSAGGRSKGKAASQLRQWLEAQGYQLPEEKLAQMGGLGGAGDPLVTAMQQAERVLAWAYDVDADKMPPKVALEATPAKRLDLFLTLYREQRLALDALMPYGVPKAAPDVAVTQQTTFVVPAQPSAQGAPGEDARVVTPAPGGRMAPPPMPGETQQDQGVAKSAGGASDSGDRTE